MPVLYLSGLLRDAMNENDYYTTLMEIIRPYLPEDVNGEEIGMESNLLQDLNINSSHLVDIVLDVEDQFDILLEDADIDRMKTVAQALDVIKSKMDAN